MSVTLKILLAAAVALLVGLAVGFFVGRAMLERSWSQPYAVLSDGAAAKLAENDADPAPKGGTKLLPAMPIGRSRSALAKMTAGDPAVATVASFGSDDDAMELHVTVENRGKCTIAAASGVAYGFDAWGRPAAANKHGEPYVAFKLDAPIEAGKKGVVAQKVRYADNATLAIAQIDATKCADGTQWKRQ